MRAAVYGVALWTGYWTRLASEVLEDVAVALENVAGELAPCRVCHEATS